MSRYVSVELQIEDRGELIEVLRSLGLAFVANPDGQQIMLDGSLECAGEPVDVRLAAGVLGSVEDFGFVHDDGRFRLVCGEPDKSLLEHELLKPLTQALALHRAKLHAEREGLEVEEHVEPDGTRRIVLKRG